MKKDRPEIEEDDGHVIANMNVEGMPWYQKKAKDAKPQKPALDLTPEETRAAIRGMLKAAMLIAGAFIGGFLLFILFCVFIWFR